MSRFVNSFRISVPEIDALRYAIDPQPGSDGFKSLYQYEQTLGRDAHGSAHRFRHNGEWSLLVIGAQNNIEELRTDDGTTVTREEHLTLDIDDARHREIILQALRESLNWYTTEQLGYWARGKSGDVFAQQPEDTVDGYEAYPGFTTRIDFSDGFYLTVDSKTKFIEEENLLAKIRRDGREAVEAEFTSRYFSYATPDRYSVELVSIAKDTTVSDKTMTIDGERMSVLEYARKTYPDQVASRIDENEPLVRMRYPWRDEPSNGAPSLMHALVDEMSGRMTGYAAKSPLDRWQTTTSFAERIGYLQIYGPRADVSDEPRTRGVGRFDYPRLAFGTDESTVLELGADDATASGRRLVQQRDWDETILAYLREFGPRKRPRGAAEIAVVHPSGSEEIALDAYRTIQSYVDEYAWMPLPDDPGTVAYDEGQKLREWVSMFGERSEGAFTLLKSDNRAYFDVINAFDGKPTQHLLEGTYRRSSGSDRFDDTLFNTAIGMAAKLGVRPQLLADELSTDLVLGLSVTGDETNSAAAILLSGEDGDLRYQTEQNLATGRSTVTNEYLANRIVTDALMTEVERRDSDPPTTLAIHRNGHYGDEELEGVESAVDTLVEDGYLPEAFTWTAIQIQSHSGYRLYDDATDDLMCPTGTYARLDEDNIVIGTYGAPHLRQGTPTALHCQRTAGAGSLDLDISALGKDIHELSFLNWGAPTMKMKEPLSTHLPARMHPVLEQGIPLRYPPF